MAHKANVMALPIPRLPPVHSAFLPCSEKSSDMSIGFCWTSGFRDYNDPELLLEEQVQFGSIDYDMCVVSVGRVLISKTRVLEESIGSESRKNGFHAISFSAYCFTMERPSVSFNQIQPSRLAQHQKISTCEWSPVYIFS